MKLTQSQLRRIIKEELQTVLDESMQKMLGLPHQYTTQDLVTAVQGLIDSPREDMAPHSREARDVEDLISNHIRDKGTPEEKEALKTLRDDFLRAIGATAHSTADTKYQKNRAKRADATARFRARAAPMDKPAAPITGLGPGWSKQY